MHSSAWRLEQHVAQLQLAGLRATVDLTRPADGLAELRTDAGPMDAGHLLGIIVPAFPAGDPGTLLERYTRGPDLVSAYRESPERPMRVDALWRAFVPEPSEKHLAALELVVSVRTPVLDGRSDLAVQSELAATEVLQLTDAGAVQCRPLGLPSDNPLELRPSDGCGPLLFRLSKDNLSYAEMVHPADFRGDELLRSAEDAAMLRIEHRLFSERLEKGVILRARVRGVFLPRDDDAQLAVEFYRAFAAAEPPLST